MIIKLRMMLQFTILISMLLSVNSYGQQIADPAFKPPIANPLYATGRGPVILLDEAHFNFHTVDGRYQPFAEFIRRDGYVVQGSREKFSKAALQKGQILIIANALAEQNQSSWKLPTPTAFTDEEIASVRDWVKDGGALLLIVDHMPFPGAAENLAKAFGIRFSNGYAVDEKAQGPIVFKLADGLLKEHAITRGRNENEKVDSVATFTGSAFQIEGEAQPLLILGSSVVSVLTTVAGQVNDDTPRLPVKGWLQGATMKFGKGRIAIFGEAAMFSAQLAGANRTPVGMNAPIAAKNPQFLLNIMHWLSGKLEDMKNPK
ncbi:MAG: DUF4350 domain-containing protein [Acidobacteriota bacterium]